MSGDVIVKVENVAKQYERGGQSVRVLDAISLEVPRGDFVALMGPSGSGKTTLLNLIAGIDRPTSGELIIDGVDIARLSRGRLARWRARSVGYIFQLYHLVPVLTAYENVELPLLVHPLSRRERHVRVARALDLVGIADRHDHYPRQLSGGQEQRVGIARAIVASPTLVVADEPTGDLDAETSEQILILLQRLNLELGMTLLMVTHDAHAAAMATRQLRLERGQLLEPAATPVL